MLTGPPSRPPPLPPRVDTKAKVKSSGERPSPRKNIENVPPKQAGKPGVTKPCASFVEHLWKTGECRECGKPRNEHGGAVTDGQDSELSRRFAAIRIARLQAQATSPDVPASKAPQLPSAPSPARLVRAERLKYEALTKGVPAQAAPGKVSEALQKEQHRTDEQLKVSERIRTEPVRKLELPKPDLFQKVEPPTKVSPVARPRLSTEGPKRQAPVRAPGKANELIMRINERAELERANAPVVNERNVNSRLCTEPVRPAERQVGGRVATEVKHEQVKQEQVKQEQVKQEQVKQEQVKQEQAKQEQAKQEQVKQEQAKGNNSNIGKLKSVWEQKTKEECEPVSNKQPHAQQRPLEHQKPTHSQLPQPQTRQAPQSQPQPQQKPQVIAQAKPQPQAHTQLAQTQAQPVQSHAQPHLQQPQQPQPQPQQQQQPKEGQVIFRAGKLDSAFVEKPEVKVAKVEQLFSEAKEKLQQQLKEEDQKTPEQRAREEREKQQEKTRQEKLRQEQIIKENQLKAEKKQREISEEKAREEAKALREQEAARQRSVAEERTKAHAQIKEKFNLLMAQTQEKRREALESEQQHSRNSGGYCSPIQSEAVCLDYKPHKWMPNKCDTCLGSQESHERAGRASSLPAAGTLKREKPLSLERQMIATNAVGSLKYGTIGRRTPRKPEASSPRSRHIPEAKANVAPVILNLCDVYEEHAWKPNICKYCKQDVSTHREQAVSKKAPMFRPAETPAKKSVKELAANAKMFKIHVPNSQSPASHFPGQSPFLSPPSRGASSPIYPEVLPMDFFLTEEGAATPGNQIRKAKIANKRRRRNTPKFAAPFY